METIRRQYYITLLAFMALLCGLCVGLSLWAIRSAERVHAEETHNQIYQIKMAFLKDTVRNVMRDIDSLRADYRAIARGSMDRISREMSRHWALSPDDFREEALDFISAEDSEGQVSLRLSEPGGRGTMMERIPADGKAGILGTKASYGPFILEMEVNQSWVDAKAKAAIAASIHAKSFENDSYIWVNEVVDWNGGDKYAIRRIHPNLIGTEGSYLSTAMADIKGNKPYLTELEGIKKDGELFSTYFFKRKDSDEIQEKLTYAALYKDFGWIVAMGIYLPDIQVYVDAAQDQSSKLTRNILVLAFSSMLALFAIGILVLSRLERWYSANTRKAAREESNRDPLTGADNRRLGEYSLADSFKRFKRGLADPAIFSFDIDDFKNVNDQYGHDAGDLVLKAVVQTAIQTMRSSDRLFRWGGEEFIVVCEGVNEGNALAIAEKLNLAISRMAVPVTQASGEKTSIRMSVSIGISWFKAGDSGPDAAVKRADQALYRAKAEGKNCARMAP
jgi:diguanylate cyclase (GGDEF)-like protein